MCRRSPSKADSPPHALNAPVQRITIPPEKRSNSSAVNSDCFIDSPMALEPLTPTYFDSSGKRLMRVREMRFFVPLDFSSPALIISTISQSEACSS